MLQSGVTPLVYAGMNVILEEIVTKMKHVSNYRYRISITSRLIRICSVIGDVAVISDARPSSTITNVV